MHEIRVTLFRGGNAAPTDRIFLVHIHLFHHHTFDHGQTPNFLLTHVILDGVTCGSSIRPKQSDMSDMCVHDSIISASLM